MYIYRKGGSLRKSENNTIFNWLKSYQNTSYSEYLNIWKTIVKFFPIFAKLRKTILKKMFPVNY